MADGSPIDQWWKSHTPARVTTNPKKAVHLATSGGDPRPYCGHRGKPTVTTLDRSVMTCSACAAAFEADFAAATNQENRRNDEMDSAEDMARAMEAFGQAWIDAAADLTAKFVAISDAINDSVQFDSPPRH